MSTSSTSKSVSTGSGSGGGGGGGGIVLRFQRPTPFPQLLRFVDNDDLEKLESISPQDEDEVPYMYFEQEEIKEDEEEEEDEDALVSQSTAGAHQFNKKKAEFQRRNIFRPKQILNIRNLTKTIKLEGRIGNTDLADSEDISKNKAYRMKKGAEEFHNCLFQFVQREQDGVIHKEIHVIPVGQMYTMRKDGSSTEILLDELEEKKKEEEKAKAIRKVGKFSVICQKIVGETEKEEEGDESGNSGKKVETQQEYLIRRFGEVSSNATHAPGKKGRGGGGGGGSSSLDGRSKLNEIGIDEDELKAEEFNGDYNGRFADDEEDHVVDMQFENKNEIDVELGGSARQEQDDLIDSDDEDEEEDAEQQEKKKLEKSVLKATGGILDDKIIQSAAATGAATVEFTNVQKAPLRKAEASSSRSDGVMTLAALKEGRSRKPSDDSRPTKRNRIDGKFEGSKTINVGLHIYFRFLFTSFSRYFNTGIRFN